MSDFPPPPPSEGDFPPPSPDHARVPDLFASPKIPSSSTSTRVCEWCATSIPDEALKCPHCTNWRKDIAEDRKKYFTCAAASVGVAVLGAVLFLGVWNASSQEEISAAFGNNEQGVWHEKVMTKSKPTVIMGMPMPGTDQKVSYEFSVGKFLSSFQGWLVIACAIGAVWPGVLARRARDTLEQKTGSRWRL